MSTHDVPATVEADAHTFETSLNVEAEYCKGYPMTLTDPAEPAGYEVFSAKLMIDEHLRGRVVEQITIWVEQGSPIDVAVDPEWLSQGDSIDLDDEDLRDEITSYLNNT